MVRKEFSLTLIDDIISYSESVESKTAVQIEKESKILESCMNPVDLQGVTEIMENNAINRQNRMATAIKKKFYHLRYNQEPHPDRQNRWDQLKKGRREDLDQRQYEWKRVMGDRHPHEDYDMPNNERQCT